MLYGHRDQVNTGLELNIPRKIGTLREPSWWVHWPGQRQEETCTSFPNPREGWLAIDSQIVSTTASQHPFIHQDSSTRHPLCTKKTFLNSMLKSLVSKYGILASPLQSFQSITPGCFLLHNKFQKFNFSSWFWTRCFHSTATLICSSQQQLAQVKSTTQISVYAWEKAKPRRETYLLQKQKNQCAGWKVYYNHHCKDVVKRHQPFGNCILSFSFLRRDVSLSPSRLLLPLPTHSQEKPTLPGQHFPLLVCIHHRKGKKRQIWEITGSTQEAA